MKKHILTLVHLLKIKRVVLFMIGLSIGFANAQNRFNCSGTVLDKANNKPVAYANIMVYRTTDSVLVQNNGAVSDEKGTFKIMLAQNGKYRFIVSSLGYKPLAMNIDVQGKVQENLGMFYLQDSTNTLKDVVVVSEQSKGKTDNGKIVYSIEKKIHEVAGTGIDVLKFIPGVQLDLKHNISLFGKTNILILVDGIERDKAFVAQLNPDMILKVEVYDTPPSNYDSNISGVINIILKKGINNGFNGNVYLEIPISTSMAYSFPTYSFNYGFKKMNLYTSYNGEINYENLKECTYRSAWNNSSVININNIQDVRQRYLSHTFHYGLDYFIDSGNQLNFYGFYNPYTHEQNGNVTNQITTTLDSKELDARRTEDDKNNAFFNSLFYKHLFNKKGKEITFDISNYYLNASNTIKYLYNPDDIALSYTQLNIQKPNQSDVTVKSDFKTPVGKKWVLSVGMKGKFQVLKDTSINQFNYKGQTYALYSALNFKNKNYNLNIGVRAEDYESKAGNNINQSIFSLLPYMALNVSINNHQKIGVLFNRTVSRPTIYQLNNYMLYDDPYSLTEGNPSLQSEFTTNITIEHSINIKNNFIVSRLFYNQTNNVLNDLTQVNDTGLFVTQIHNSGTIKQFGLQLSGGLKWGMLLLNPSVKFYYLSTTANQTAKINGVADRNALVFESNLSAMLALKKQWSISLLMNYSMPKNNIQDNSFCDMLYILSLDKVINKNFKIGIASALPFDRRFIYQGSETNAQNFHSRYEGNLLLPTLPAWFKLTYRFSSGKSINKISRTVEEVDKRPLQRL